MKKWMLPVVCLLGLCLSGCNHDALYDDEARLASSVDSYSYRLHLSQQKNSEYTESFSYFSGCDTIWRDDAGSGILSLTGEAEVEKGDWKLVLIGPEDQVTTVYEGSGDFSASYDLEVGSWRLKSVGRQAAGEITFTLDMDWADSNNKN